MPRPICAGFVDSRMVTDQRVYRWYGKDDRECYVFEVDGRLYHAHDNSGRWASKKLNLGTLEHHAIMNHGIQRVKDVPDGLQDEIASLRDE